jgi:tryptophan synthase alpha chain
VTRIGKLFEDLKTEGRAALIAYITAGDPSLERTASLVAALERGGADLIELGVPFSDPVADGPVIQRASERALRAGTTLAGVLEVAREVRSRSAIPMLVFTYLNPALRYGLEKLADDAMAAGVDGCLLTDLSVEEAGVYVGAMRERGFDTVFLAAPTSTPERLALVAKYSTGFVYLISRMGVTGAQASLSDTVGPLVEEARKITDLPLAVGFGISKPEHAAAVGAVADGVVVGSAFVKIVEAYADSPELEDRLEALARDLASAMPRK